MKQPFDRASVKDYLADKTAKTNFEHRHVYPLAAGLLIWLIALVVFMAAQHPRFAATIISSSLSLWFVALGTGVMAFAIRRYYSRPPCANCAEPMQKFSDSKLEPDDAYVWVFSRHTCKRYFVWRVSNAG